MLGLVPLAARAADSGRTAEGLEEVVVTAQKRSETLITVPASVTALQGADLENQGVTSFSDYMTLVPGLTNNSGGAPGMGLTILRGLNTGNGQLTSTVGNYVDDVAVSGNGSMSFGIFMTPDPDIGDVDHIEVLKGPQATLYGANTLGGLIKIVTNKPDVTKNSGSVRLEASSLKGDNGYSVSGVANFVLDSNSTFAIRVSGFKRETPGYLKNVTLGTKHLGGSDSRGGRVALRWVPNDKFDATLTASLQNTDVTGWTYEYVDMNTLKPAYGDNTYATLFDPYTRNKYRTFSLAINYQADAGTLTSSTSYAKVSSVQLQDWTDYLGPLNDFCFLAPTYETPCGPPPAGTAFAVVQDPSIKKFTQELRFATKRFGAWEGIGGLFFTDEDTAVHMPLANWNSTTMQQQVEPWGNVYAADSKARYREWAAFADGTYYFTDAFDLTVGGRYSNIRQTFNTCSSGWLTFSDPYCQPNKVNDNSFTYAAVAHHAGREHVRACGDVIPAGRRARPTGPGRNHYFQAGQNRQLRGGYQG
jgi:outer membrane receptor protein involved in Fe transport